jgi:hypothetical protein
MYSILRVYDGQPRWEQAIAELGQRFVKEAAETKPAYNLVGTLYLSSSGWIMLSVPNALVRGIFAAMNEPGIELPPSGETGQLNAHVSVLRPSEIDMIGGPDKITERGKQFHYSLGRLVEVEPEGWPEMAKVWFVRIHSPALQFFRRSYGLSSLPNDGKYDFHVSVACRRRGVLGRNDVRKAAAITASAALAAG